MEESLPDVVMLDINMPDLSGEAVARKISAQWGDQAPVLWFVTGNPLATVDGLGKGVLLKPVNSSKLRQAIWGD